MKNMRRDGTGKRRSNEGEKKSLKSRGEVLAFDKGDILHPLRRKDEHKNTDTGACVDVVVDRRGSTAPVVYIFQ